ncbi:MAG: HAD-IIIC family phosphatase [Candidatus Riflebacteria bacterium]|nr:HAD-IIIC family phosphatase [Candidatus Riflebacteria bacterium]
MELRQHIYETLSTLIDTNDRLLVIHSSLFHLRFPIDGLKGSFLDALRLLLRDGKTLALATFTWDFCGRKRYHFHDSISETGQLGGWFLELEGVRRTPHPIYSFAVAGALAEELIACKNSTTFGEDSVFAFFERQNARVIMLGCGWDSCTQYHKYEEEVLVPYRLFKDFIGEADYGDGYHNVTARMFVRDLAINPLNDFSPIADEMSRNGSIKSTSLGRGSVQTALCSDVARAARYLLKQDPFVLLHEPEKIRLAVRNKNIGKRPLKMALIGATNLELLKTAVQQCAAMFAPDRLIEVYAPPFGQQYNELFAGSSELKAFNADFTFFVDRLEDILCIDTLNDRSQNDNEEELFDRFTDALKLYASTCGGHIYVNSFINSQPLVLGISDATVSDGVRKRVLYFNEQLEVVVSNTNNVSLFDLNQAALLFRTGPTFDERLWRLGKFPFSQSFSEYLIRRYCGIMLSHLGKTVRVIVVDLDNTLWGGVLGEDGFEGIKIGGDYPGNAFKAFQRTLKGLSGRGIALAICSKNEEKSALEVINSHPEMVLREEDFAASRINWNLKSQNIQEIADELNIGLDNILFVDDNPAEREQMRLQLPRVKTFDFPEDPAFYSSALLSAPELECSVITVEDKKRAAAYQAKREIDGQRRAFDRIEDFYASLDSRVHLFSLDKGNIDRAVQLISKTNQFNATTKRYTRQDLDTMKSGGDWVIVIGTEDKFSALENIGVIILRWNAPAPRKVLIDSFLLSCRVLGRGIEVAVLSWARRTARELGMDQIIGRIIPTEKNGPVRSIYSNNGFVEETTGGDWFYDVRKVTPEIPDWIQIIEHFDKCMSKRACEPVDEPVSEIRSEGIQGPESDIAEEKSDILAQSTQDESVSDISSKLDGLIRKFLHLAPDFALAEAGLGLTPGWDSMRQLELLLSIESAFDITFRSQEMEKTTTYKDLRKLMDVKFTAQNARSVR